MSDDPPVEVLSALPRRRPHRRSQKRGGPPIADVPATAIADVPAAAAPAAPKKRAQPKRARLRQPAQPAGGPPAPRSRRPAPNSGNDIVGTAVQAAAEIAEIGLSVSARALRNAISRLPKP